jgi:3-dehydroquinate dehydratase type I
VRPRICVSVMPRTVEEGAVLQARAVQKEADLFEIRLDRLGPSADLKALNTTKSILKIAATRQFGQGGEFRGTEEERFRTLLNAAETGFDYIDLEESAVGLDSKIKAIRAAGSKTIISHHNFKSTPTVTELEKIRRRITKCTPDICKVVTTATSNQDNLVTLSFLQRSPRDLKMVCFAMGEEGKISRVVSPMFGAHFTIASMEAGGETAPGQLTIDDLRGIYSRLGLDLAP